MKNKTTSVLPVARGGRLAGDPRRRHLHPPRPGCSGRHVRPDPVAFTNAPAAAQSAYLMAALTNGDPTPTNIAPVAVAGHTAWMMVAAALALLMTLPGLALFYGGLVRSKNVLSMLAMCLGITGLVAIIWWAVGYPPGLRNELRQPLHRRQRVLLPQGRRFGPQHQLRLLDSAERLLHLPADLRDHHPGPDLRRHRRTTEVHRPDGLRRPLDVRGLLPAGPHGLGSEPAS